MDVKPSEALKHIHCPLCGRKMHLLKKDFTVTVENERGEWSCEPAIICPWEGCGIEFFVKRSNVEYVVKKP